jgi:hypothetical protein
VANVVRKYQSQTKLEAAAVMPLSPQRLYRQVSTNTIHT